jgi:hypothetical protein
MTLHYRRDEGPSTSNARSSAGATLTYDRRSRKIPCSCTFYRDYYHEIVLLASLYCNSRRNFRRLAHTAPFISLRLVDGQNALAEGYNHLCEPFFQRAGAGRIGAPFAKPPVGFFRVAKNILSQCLDPRQPHDTIGFVNSQWLSCQRAMDCSDERVMARSWHAKSVAPGAMPR